MSKRIQADAVGPIADRLINRFLTAERQRDQLLGAIEKHRVACEYTSPIQYMDQDKDLYAAANQIDQELKGEEREP